MVKQQSVTEFNVKLTPMDSWSVPTDILYNPPDLISTDNW